MSRRIFLLAMLMAVPTMTRGERVNRPRTALFKEATDIVVGTITRYYHNTSRNGDYEVTYTIAEIEVHAVEKGQAIRSNDTIFAQFWHQRWVGAGFPPPGRQWSARHSTARHDRSSLPGSP